MNVIKDRKFDWEGIKTNPNLLQLVVGMQRAPASIHQSKQQLPAFEANRSTCMVG